MQCKTSLQIVREQAGETLSSMASKLEIGVSRYYMIEKGERPANPNLVAKIAYLLKVKVEQIFSPHSFTVREETNSDNYYSKLSTSAKTKRI